MISEILHKKRFLGCIILMCTLSACYRSVRVSTNTYTDYQQLSSGFPENSSFCLASVKTDLSAQEIKMKLDVALKRAGYRINNSDNADYYLVFDYNTDIQQGTYTVPITLPGTTQTTHGNVYGQGYTSYNETTYTTGPTTLIQQNYTYFIHTLSLSAYNAKIYRSNNTETMVWSGKAVNVNDSSDLRVAIDYLIAALFKHFGKASYRVVDHSFGEWFGNKHEDIIVTE